MSSLRTIQDGVFGNVRIRALLVFLLAFSMRLAYIVELHTYQRIDTAEMVSVARSLALSHLFGNPFPTHTGPTAIVPPAYPILLSLIYAAFGTGVHAQAVQEIITALVSSVGIMMIVFFAESADYPVGAGMLAALLGALLPIKLWIETKGAWSTPYDALILLILCTFTLRHWKDPRFTSRNALLHGVLWGLAMLFAPTFFPLLMAFLLAGWFLYRQDQRSRYFRWTGLLLLVVAVVLTPWTIRNFRRFGGFVFVRDNLGLELYVANNDRARPTLEENMKLPKRPHPDNPMEAERLVELGELAYNQEKLRGAIGWIGSHPNRFVLLTVQRFLYFWYPNSDQLWKRVVAGLITFLGWTGFILSISTSGFGYEATSSGGPDCAPTHRSQRLAAIMIAILWSLYPLLYYVMQADPRYPYPLYWTLLLFAAVFGLRETLGSRFNSLAAQQN